MLAFNESDLSAKLQRLPYAARAAFAGACAERLFPLYQVFNRQTGQGDPNILRRALDSVREVAVGHARADQSLAALADTCEGLFPPENENWTDMSAYAQNAAAAIAYALRFLITQEMQFVVWAPLQGYEAADYHAHNAYAIQFDEPGAEKRILGSPEVQLELSRQRDDLAELALASTTSLDAFIRSVMSRSQPLFEG